MNAVHVIVPAGIDDPRRPSGGNVYDRYVCRELEAFGWRVLEIDGHDFDQILAACADARAAGGGSRPTMILARTTKGRGFSFTEGRFEWHSRVATADEAEAARAELAGEPS